MNWELDVVWNIWTGQSSGIFWIIFNTTVTRSGVDRNSIITAAFSEAMTFGLFVLFDSQWEILWL